MMTAMIMLFLLFSSAVAQSLVPPVELLVQAKTPFLLGAVIYYALARSGRVMLIFALAAGIMHDALSAIPMGYSALWFVLIGAGINRSRDVIIGESPLTAALLGGIFGIAFVFATYASLKLAGEAVGPLAWWQLTLKAAGTGGLGMIVAPALFVVAGRVEQWLGTARRKAA